MNHLSRTIVLVSGGPIIGGKEIVSLTLAKGLRSAGFKPIWFVSSWLGEGVFIARLRKEGIEFCRMRLGFISISLSLKPIWWTIDQLRYWPALLAAYRMNIGRVAPSVVIHCNWHHALLLSPLLDPSRDIYWSHEIFPNNGRYRWVFRQISRRVARIVCVSHAAARSLATLGVPRERICVIHNGTQFDVDMPPAAVGPQLRLGIAGQIGPWKGHDDLVDAVAQLNDRGVNVTLKIFGNGQPDYIESLKAKIRSRGIDNHVEWCGFVADPAQIFGAIDVCVVPTRSEEPFATSALEASLARRAVIAAAVGGLPEIVQDFETGFLVEPGNADQIATAIERFVRRPELVVTMGEAAHRRAAAHFTGARFTEDFIKLIEEIAAA